MANPWFRMYSEFAFDHKLQMMTEAHQRRFVMLLCLRCGNGDVTLHDTQIAFQLRISEQEWQDTKQLFVQNGIIDKDNKVMNWDKRQFLSDSSRERVARFRERHRNATSNKSNVTVTAQDTDTDTDTEQNIKSKRSKAAMPPQDVDFNVWEDWKQLRKSKRATVSDTVVEQARKEATKAGMSLNSFLKEWCLRGSQGLKAEWLTNNQSDKRTEHQRRQDAQTQAIFGHIYNTQQPTNFIEGEVYEEPPITRRLGR